MAGVSGPMAWSSSCDVVFKFPRDWRSRTHQWHRPQNSFCWQKTGVWDGDSIAALFEAKDACDLVLKQMPENTKALGKWLIQQCLGLMFWQNIVYDFMNVSTEHGLICWFCQYNTEQTQEFNTLHFAFREHHRDSEANSLNELRPAWPNCWVQHGVACAWHRRCTVERKLKCSNVNMWRPDFGESLRSFHSKKLFCNLLQHCARISYYRKTSKGFFLCGSTWYPIWVNEDACFEACKDLRRLLDIDPNIQDREWMIIQLCHGCRWSSKTTQLFDLFCCLISFNRVQLFFLYFHALPTKYENLTSHSTETPGRKLAASGRKQHWSERDWSVTRDRMISSGSGDKLIVEIWWDL